MSQLCPLCGNNKNESSIFCDTCKNKIENEYEVDVTIENTTNKKDNHTRSINIISEDYKDNRQSDSNGIDKRKSSSNKTKNIKIFLSIAITSIIAVSAFFVYKEYVIKENKENSIWAEAVQSNTISAYLDYMVNFPKGKNYSFAEEAIMILKKGESEDWTRLQTSDNSSELKEFINSNPQSAYAPLIKRRLDSITWQSSIKENTRESYQNYLRQYSNGDYDGEHEVQANEKVQLLTQKSEVVKPELDKIKEVSDEFFSALSAVNAENIEKHLAPRVFQFFNIGGGSKEKIVGDLLISGSKTQAPTIKFIPNISGLTYEKTSIEHFKVNIPLQKQITSSNGEVSTSYGFIIQMELDNDYKIVTITEIASY